MVTNVITKCNGKDKVVDFRDKLSRSLPDEYAMMHQSGGQHPCHPAHTGSGKGGCEYADVS